ncbi:MAG: molecular chaperone TorD family protein [Chloroflexi bacterium]|nr:molecular chaperone TorD family protein [Chloroflexota bacterium]
MQELNRIVARASIYGVSALAFAYPEDEVTEDIREGVTTLMESLEAAGVDREAIEKGNAFLRLWASTESSIIKQDYSDLFIGKQQFRLDESDYDKTIFYRHQRIADVSGFYRAFGFERSTESFERQDFVGMELEFMQVLLLKLAYAMENGWDDHAEMCRDAEAKFFKEHLEWWIPDMCERLRGASPCEFYKSLSSFLESFIKSEASRYLQPA